MEEIMEDSEKTREQLIEDLQTERRRSDLLAALLRTNPETDLPFDSDPRLEKTRGTPNDDHQAAEDLRNPQQHEVTRGKTRVLLVDDDVMIRRAYKSMLSSIGYDVIVADSGLSAVETFRDAAQGIDLVVLDLLMPFMDGASCFQKLKAIDADVRVILTTGHGRRQTIEKLIANGALGVLRKPFDINELKRAIEDGLRTQTGPSGGRSCARDDPRSESHVVVTARTTQSSTSALHDLNNSLLGAHLALASELSTQAHSPESKRRLEDIHRELDIAKRIASTLRGIER